MNQGDAATAGQLTGDTFSTGTLSFPATVPDGHEMWFGSGNAPTNYNIAADTPDNLYDALKIHVRTGADITPSGSGPNGEQFYNAPAGDQPGAPTRGAFNIDYVVNTGANGDTVSSADLSKYTSIMQVTGEFAGGSATADFQLNPTNHVWEDVSNPNIGFGGDDFNQPGATAGVMSHITENSINFGFASMQEALGATQAQLTTAGTQFDVKLATFSGGNMLSEVHDHITLVPPTV